MEEMEQRRGGRIACLGIKIERPAIRMDPLGRRIEHPGIRIPHGTGLRQTRSFATVGGCTRPVQQGSPWDVPAPAGRAGPKGKGHGQEVAPGAENGAQEMRFE